MPTQVGMIGPEVGEAVRAIGKPCGCVWQACQFFPCIEHRDMPPDVAGLPDADAWNTLDRWLREHDVPQETHQIVSVHMDRLLQRMRQDLDAQRDAAAESRARMTFTDGGAR